MAKPILITTSTKAPISVIQRAYQTFFQRETVAEVESDWTFWLVDAAPIPEASLQTYPPIEEWLKFQQLVAKWQQEKGAISSITEAALCPAYQSIVGMGPDAVPMLLAQLESEGDQPDQWFWALRAITRANPVDEADRGDFVRMARAWLQWGKDNGYAW